VTIVFFTHHAACIVNIMSSIRSELEKKAKSALLQHAFFRWESAVVLAGTILFTVLFTRPFPWWPVWGWPLLGLLGLGSIVYSSLTDAETNAQVIQDLLRARFDVNQIRDQALRTDLEYAFEFQRNIEAYVRRQRDSARRTRLKDTANQLVDWIANVYRLALRLDAYRFDVLLAKERALVPDEIDSLVARREKENNPTVQQELDQALESKNKQWQMLRSLDTRMKQAELKLEQSLTALATVYNQLQLIAAQDVDSSRSDHLHADIREQIERLNDLISSINEVYDYDKSSST
jgi:hypothetical protein